MELRPYQHEAIAATDRYLQKGYKSPLSVLATGLGKTVVAHGQIKNLSPISEKRTLFLVHLQDLVRQTRRSFSQMSPDWNERKWTREGRPGLGIVMGDIDQPDARVIIGTPQTLGGAGKKADFDRLQRCLKFGRFDTVVVDEAHMSIAEGYLRLVNAIREDNPEANVLGFTATAWREDGLGLNNLFDVISCNYNLRWGINHNYLCQILDPLQIETQVTLPDQLTNDEELASAIDVKNWAELVLKGYLERGENRLAVAFMPSVEHSREFCRYAQSQGIPCAHVDSEGCITQDGFAMGTKQRYAIYEWFGSDKPVDQPRILTNYNILTTGWDCPATACIIWARPTQSSLIMTQAIGRGTRLHPSKDNLLILDFALNGLKVVNASDITGLAYDSNGETAEKEVEELAEGQDMRDAASKSGETYVSGRGIVVKIGKLMGHSKNAWHCDDRDNTMSLACGESHVLFVLPPYYTLAKRIEEGMLVGERALDKKPDDAAKKAFYNDLSKAFNIFNNYTVWRMSKVNNRWELLERPLLVDDNPMSLFDRLPPIEDELMKGTEILTKKTKQWRRKPASVAQLELLRRLGESSLPDNMGEAAKMITHAMAAPRVEKYIERLRQSCKIYGILDSELKEMETA